MPNDCPHPPIRVPFLIRLHRFNEWTQTTQNNKIISILFCFFCHSFGVQCTHCLCGNVDMDTRYESAQAKRIIYIYFVCVCFCLVTLSPHMKSWNKSFRTREQKQNANRRRRKSKKRWKIMTATSATCDDNDKDVPSANMMMIRTQKCRCQIVRFPSNILHSLLVGNVKVETKNDGKSEKKVKRFVRAHRFNLNNRKTSGKSSK